VAHLERKLEEKDRRIEEQDRRIEEQDRRIEEQNRIIEEWKRGHRVRPRSNPKKKKKPGRKRKKPGRPKGHEGSQRPIPDHIDKEVERTKDKCDDCKSSLTPTGRTEDVFIENLIPARIEVEKNVLFEYLCDGCGQVHWSELPPEYGDKPLPGQPKLGPGVLKLVLMLRFSMQLSSYKISEFLEKQVGIKVSPSGIYQLLERTAGRTKTVADDILEHAQMSSYVNMDETIHWEDGKKLWAWVMSNRDLSYFHIAPSRGHAVIEKLLCELDENGNVIAPYEGTVVSDFMGAYRTCGWMIHQFCWVHLLRDAAKAFEMSPDERSEKFSDMLHEIYVDALDAQSTQDESKKRSVRIRLGQLNSNAELGIHPDVKRLQARAHLEFHCLLHFMDHPEIPAHNNGGELAVRALVIMRKILYGTRSERGTQVHSQFMSMSQTAKKQGIDLGDFVIDFLAAGNSGQPPPSIFQS